MKVGDVVRLKSGGPKMTVMTLNAASLSYRQALQCSWFDEEKQEFQYGNFPPESLMLVPETDIRAMKGA